MNVPDPGLEGKELDAAVAEEIMEYRRFKTSRHDVSLYPPGSTWIESYGREMYGMHESTDPLTGFDAPKYSSDLNLAHEVARKVVEKTDYATFMSAIAYVIYRPEMTFPDFLIVREAQRDIPYVDPAFSEWGIFNADPATICRAALLSHREAVVSPSKSIPNAENLDCSDSLRELATNEENEVSPTSNAATENSNADGVDGK